MGTPRDKNEGEGNKTADRNYREATQKFVESERGQREIENAGNVSPREEQDIRRAEEQAKQRAKDHDPAEMSGGRNAAGTRQDSSNPDSSDQDSSDQDSSGASPGTSSSRDSSTSSNSSRNSRPAH